MIPMSGSGLVSYFTVVRVGSRNEVEPGHTGFAHFFEHIMFRGTKNRPGSVYDGIVAGHLARFVGVTGGIESIDALFAAEAAVTPEEIMHAAKKYLVADRRTTVLLKGEGGEGKAEGEPSRLAAASTRRDLPKDSRIALPHPRHPRPTKEQSIAARRERALAFIREAVGGEFGRPRESNEAPAPVLLPDPADPTISFRFWFMVGSLCDPPGKEGLASLTAAMLAEGATQSKGYEQILDALFPLAAGYSASASEEMTVISGRVHRDNLDRFYPLLIEAVCRPAFKREDFDRIKARMLNHLQNTLRYSNDEELSRAVLHGGNETDANFYGSPQGTVEGLRGISLNDVKDFYKKHYLRQDVVIGLAGGYDPTLPDRMKADLAALPLGLTSDVEVLKKALVEETPSPITYVTPKPESVLAEDREISVFPLHIKAENIRIVPVSELFEK
jgi:predicted Zn-dependent peptidase